MVEYWYGLRDGNVVSIQDISVEMKGQDCGCVCPACRRPLVACALGENSKVARHFRHKPELEPNGTHDFPFGGCDAYSANESGLHIMAKQIIQEERRVMVPSVEICAKTILDDVPIEKLRELSPYMVEEIAVLVCEHVQLEQYVNGFKPDVVMQILSNSASEMYVEINAGHAVDEVKRARVQAHGVPMLEINVQSFLDHPVNKEELRQFLLESSDKREWIHFPLSEEVKRKARYYFENLDVVRKYRQDKERRERGKNRIMELMVPQNYAAEVCRLRNDNAFHQMRSKYQNTVFLFLKGSKEVPFYIDIPITGEMLFQCDRRIWQGIIFGRFIYRRNGRDGKPPTFTPENWYIELQNTYHIRTDPCLAYKQTIKCKEQEEKVINLSITVIQQYLNHLTFLGFIKRRKGRGVWYEVSAPRTIEPPTKDAANFLKEILHQVDGNSFNVSDIIDEKKYQFTKRKQAERDEKIAEWEALRRKEKQEQKERELRERQLEEYRRQEEMKEYDEQLRKDKEETQAIFRDFRQELRKRRMKTDAGQTAENGYVM